MARRRDNAIREEDMMVHDKIKAAARERMARTGEPYALARRAVMRDHEEAQNTGNAWDTTRSQALEFVADQLTEQGREARRRLTSAPGIEEIQRRFAALHAFRSLGHTVEDRPTAVTDTGRPRWQCRRCGSDLQLDSTGGWVSSSGTGRCLHEDASW